MVVPDHEFHRPNSTSSVGFSSNYVHRYDHGGLLAGKITIVLARLQQLLGLKRCNIDVASFIPCSMNLDYRELLVRFRSFKSVFSSKDLLKKTVIGKS